MKNGSILCGGVGSGKSRTALAYYYLCNGGKLGNKYSYIFNECPPMNDPPLDLYIITTARKRDTMEWEGEFPPFHISTVVVDSWNNLAKYKDVRDSFFIFDEQRVIGNGVWVKSFLKIAKSNHWILLSATPGDSWQDYIPVFIANGFFRNRLEFTHNHVVYARYTNFPKIDRYVNTQRLVRLRDSILIQMDYQVKTTSHHEDIFVPYDIVEYKHSMKMRWDFMKKKPIETAAELCYVLRRVVNSYPERGDMVLRIFKDHPRVIIFYNFDYELDILKNLPYGKGVEVAQWNGHKHQEIPESERWVYLVQYTAGCEGWNCVKTDTIIFYSLNYSQKVMVQAAGRIDRLNTMYKDLYYFHLKSRSPIDLAISEALRRKKKFIESKFIKWER